MILYYHGSREQLVATALRRIANDFLAELESRLEGLRDPAEVIDAVADLFLSRTSQRSLLAAYLGLLAESATDPMLQTMFMALRERGDAIAHRALDELEANGHELSMERGLLIFAARSGIHGIGLELLQHGPTPELEQAVALARLSAPMLLFD